MAEKVLNDLSRDLRPLFTKGNDALQRENFDYAIDLFTHVLAKEPRVFECRKALRTAQLRKAGSGGGFFKMRKRPMPERTSVQALVPDGATVLHNPHGTAPGLALEVRPNPFRQGGRPTWLIMLPGPPRELRPMFADSVAPLLRSLLPLEGEYVCRTLRTTGIGESLAQERIAEPLSRLVAKGLDLGYCAQPGRVDVRLAAGGAGAQELVREAEEITRARLDAFVFGEGDDDLPSVIIRLLTKSKETLALAESCTGGLIAHQLTNVPGASAVLLAGLVTYSNQAKEKLLGVRAETLAEHGAVSQAVAREMAEGARRQIGADYGLAVTGIAGPGGGTEEKPVGTVSIALATPQGTLVERNFNALDRETFKQLTAQQALEMLRRQVLGIA